MNNTRRIIGLICVIAALLLILLVLVPRIKTEPDSTRAQTATGPTRAAPVSYEYYLGSKSSKKFHLPTCSYLPDQVNQVTFSSREDALNAGYTPCGHCNP